jgi:hypothetical protein
MRRIRRVGHIAGLGETRNAYKILLWKKRHNFGDLGVEGGILTIKVFKTSDHLNWIKLELGPSRGACDHKYGTSGSIKTGFIINFPILTAP